MMQQRGASGNGIMGYASGGGVPRQTEIGGQPHMLAYINPEEEQMLYAAGGSGEPGPGGVPAFRTLGMSPGEAGARGGGYQGGDTVGSPTGGGYGNNNSPAELAYVAARQAEAQRAANAAVARQEAEMQAVLQDAADKAAIAQQEADLQAAQSNAYMDVPNNAYMDVSNNFDSDVGDTFGTGNIYTETTPGASTTNSGNANNNSNIIQQEQDAANAAAATAAEAEAQRVAIEAQAQQAEQTRLADEQAESQRIQALVNDSIATTNQAPAIPVIGQDIDLDPYAPKFAGFPSAPSEFAGFPSAPVVDPVLDPVVNPAEAFRANEQRLANASGANIVNPFDDQDEIVEQALSAAELATSEFLGNNAVQAGINLGASDGSGTSPSVITSLAMGDGTESPTELQNIKNRVSVVEGTSDADGYNRLLDKGEKGTFVNSKPLSEMTVAEAVAFGQGEEYRNYSRRVLGRSPDELPSTPMGKYQIVGNTLADLVNRGIVDPDAKFDAATQEKLGDYLINNRGYDKLQSGEITLAEFEANLGKEFEGIQVQGLGDVTVSSADEIDKNIVLASATGTDTGESTSEYLRRRAEEKAASGDTSSLVGDGVQVAAASSRGPLSDLIMSQALGLDEIDNLVNASAVTVEGAKGDIDDETGQIKIGNFTYDSTNPLFQPGGEFYSVVQENIAREIASGNAEMVNPAVDIAAGLPSISTADDEVISNLVRPEVPYYAQDPIDGITEAPDVETRAELTERLAKEYEDPIDNRSNEERLAAVGALKTKNTAREEFANLLTPNDGAVYINGQLVDEITGQSMTGGGYSSSKPEDYVYGVSDFSANNAEIDSTTFSSGDPDNPSIQENVIKANKKMREDIPPSDLAYFASFLPGAVIPVIGQALGEKMLSGGIEDRKALIKAETDALKAGAEPRYDDDNNYIGHMTYEDQLANVFGSGNIYNDGTTFNKDGSVNEPGLSLVGGGTTQSDKVIGEGSYVSAKDDYNTPAFVDPYARTAVPSVNSEQDEIDYLLAQAAGTAKTDEGRKGPVGKIGVRKIRPRVSVPVRPEKTGDRGGVTFRTPKQFADGGSVTPNIDSFFSNMR